MNQAEHRACLLMGSNILPELYLPRAVRLLQGKVNVLKTSSVWETASIGSGGPNFLNAAVSIITSLQAGELKDRVLRPLEASLGRVRSADKNAPRTIDLDIILFDEQLLDPALWQFAHRAVPVAELYPDFQSGTGEALKTAASRLALSTMIRLRLDVSLRPQLQIQS